VGESVAFWVLAAIVVMAALAVVCLKDVFRAALSLVLCFLGVAGLYITLSADFLAAVQILVYVGAISILIILAVMLTRDVQHGSPSGGLKAPAIIIALLLLGGVTYAVLKTPWPVSAAAPLAPTTSALSGLLFGPDGFTLPLEIAPVLLLAAVVGAIVLAREK
jgi:NADH:ubiquinone oxidoreductase subunit 6 (subunit J)